MRAGGILKGFLLAVLLGMGPVALRAQDYRAFLTVGSYSTFNKYSFIEYDNSYHSAYSTGPQIAIGGEVPLTSVLGVELSFGLARNDLRVTNSTTRPATELTYGVDKMRLSGDLVIHVPGSILHGRPYLVFGPEFDRLAPYGSAASSYTTPGFANDSYVVLVRNQELGFNLGGGLELKVLPKQFPHAAVRLDLRDHIFAAPRYGVPETATTGAFYPVHGPINNVEVSVGFVVHFEL
jgi:hypothetical protein